MNSSGTGSGGKAEYSRDRLQKVLTAHPTQAVRRTLLQKYQRISHIVKLDTLGKMRRKTGLEEELTQLEKDIFNRLDRQFTDALGPGGGLREEIQEGLWTDPFEAGARCLVGGQRFAATPRAMTPAGLH